MPVGTLSIAPDSTAALGGGRQHTLPEVLPVDPPLSRRPSLLDLPKVARHLANDGFLGLGDGSPLAAPQPDHGPLGRIEGVLVPLPPLVVAARAPDVPAGRRGVVVLDGLLRRPSAAVEGEAMTDAERGQHAPMSGTSPGRRQGRPR